HSQNARFECIDGMRGFLALGVFIHHSAIWHQYIQIGLWEAPKSNIYNQFGQTSVSFFFMITSFLFISKLINSAEKGFNWRNFFISRIFRLGPMYYFSLLVIIISVMFITNWQLQIGIRPFLDSIFKWSLFTINGLTDINGSELTSKVGAGVVWSLPYEWLFYFSLPIISIFILKVKHKIGYIALSVIFIFVFYKVHEIYPYHIYSFIGGAIAPFLIRYTQFYKKINKNLASLVIIACLIILCLHSTAFNIYNVIFSSLAFTLVALGFSVFGLLKNSTLKFLGEICYSTYLLHGIVLFTVFYFGFGFEYSKSLNPFQYSLVIFSITPIVVIISFLGFKFIEKPFMDKSKIIIQKLNLRDEKKKNNK
ncbi:MAG: acyltransferase, partial [Bacteroidetes bacterium]|nr:acyltransferase [Bacteroidota bacterium]